MIKYTCKIGPKEREALSYIALEKTAFAKRTKLISILSIIVGGLSTYLAIKSIMRVGFNSSDLIMLLISLLIIYMGLDGAKRLQKLYFKDQISVSDNNKTDTYEYIINAEGITKFIKDKQIFDKWELFKTWAEYEHYIYLRKKNDDITLIDKNLLTKDQIKELTTYLKLHIK